MSFQRTKQSRTKAVTENQIEQDLFQFSWITSAGLFKIKSYSVTMNP